jgi:hypothetical protein
MGALSSIRGQWQRAPPRRFDKLELRDEAENLCSKIGLSKFGLLD